MLYTKSLKELEKAKEAIVGGVKRMNRLDLPEYYPTYFTHAKDCYVWDIDGRRYIDYISAKGAIILGYSHDVVNQEVIKQIVQSNIMPLNSPIQNQLAAAVKDFIPCAQRVRFLRTGSCATSALIRLARTYKKRDIILTSGYHGWHDNFMVGRNGVVKTIGDTIINFNSDISLLEKLIKCNKEKIAAIFITPEPCFFDQQFYKSCYELSKENDILFLLDEIKTGFRYDIHGYQNSLEFIPDGATFSKAISNGFPISVVTGTEELMAAEENTHISGTFDTEVSSMAAAVATLEFMKKERIHEHIKKNGKMLIQGLNNVFASLEFPAKCMENDPTSFHIIFEDDTLAREFYRKCAENGLLFYCFSNVNVTYAHTKDIVEETIAICKNVIMQLQYNRTSIENYHVTQYMEKRSIKRLSL